MSRIVSWVNGNRVVRDMTPAEEADGVFPVTLADLEAEAGRRLDLIGAGYSTQERETWTRQIEEARAVIADATASAPILTPRAAARGVTITEMAQLVLTLADQYASQAGVVLAARDTLAAMDPIPTDFTSDTHWTAN